MLTDAVRQWAAGSRRAVDATVGGGGHAELLLAAGAEVLAIDRDPDAIAAARARLGGGEPRVRFLESSYAAPAALAAVRDFRPDRILLDLGVSSHQVDVAARGFTFRPGAPLDMRMAGSGKEEAERGGLTAADILNTWPVDRLAKAFVEYADERPGRARALGREVVRRRLRHRFAISDDFVNAIRATSGPRAGPPDFARLFQALRIVVNRELDELAGALPALRDELVPGGRLGVITYHSGEDRITKQQFREWGRACVCPPRQPVCICRGRPLGRVGKPVTPAAAEVAANPRARSARLRVFEVGDAV